MKQEKENRLKKMYNSLIKQLIELITNKNETIVLHFWLFGVMEKDTEMA